MIENIENIKLDEILEEIQYLKHENNTLKKHNRVLSDELTYFKEYSADLEELNIAIEDIDYSDEVVL